MHGDRTESAGPNPVHSRHSTTGHIEQGTTLDAKADLKPNRDYLDFFEELGLTKPEAERTLKPKVSGRSNKMEELPHEKTG